MSVDGLCNEGSVRISAGPKNTGKAGTREDRHQRTRILGRRQEGAKGEIESMCELLRGSDVRLRGTNEAVATRTAIYPFKMLAFVGAAFLMWGLVLAYASSPAQAATLRVNSLLDTTANDGQCTLRGAIFNANDQSGSTDCAAGSGSDVIDIGVTGTVNLTGALPNLSSDMSIDGPGTDQFTVRRDTGGDYRIFVVTSDGIEPVVSISGITISNGNAANSLGGGILNFGTLTISGSTISGNRAGFGGGVFSDTFLSSTQKSTITNSTISGNTATDTGGGVHNFAGLSVIEHSTITNNTAPGGRGSGVASRGDEEFANTEVLSSIISANQGTDVDLTGVIGISTNSFVSRGYNLVGDGNATDAFNQTGDQENVGDPKLGALADNGGPTLTHALIAGSPAIDKGNTDLATDQRGKPRTFDDPSIAPAQDGDNSDIGSFEAQGVLNTAPEARGDAYSTNEDTALTVAASDGVLQNDKDADNDTLTAELVEGVDHGTLTFNSNGSFTYTPNANYNGPDSFTYRATDGTAYSDTITVKITVEAIGDAPTVTVDKGGRCGPVSDSRGTINLALSDPDTAPQDLILSATSTNRAVVPNGSISFGGGSDASRTLTVTRLAGTGASVLTLTISDGEKEGSANVRVLSGGASADTLVGGAVTDMIFARKGPDTASGRGANDLLCGGNGKDELTGGLGADHFGGGSGTDTATDFDAAQGDTKAGIP